MVFSEKSKMGAVADPIILHQQAATEDTEITEDDKSKIEPAPFLIGIFLCVLCALCGHAFGFLI